MKQKVRESLITAKAAQSWQGQFDQKVDELMVMVNKVDTEAQVLKAGELLDVYRKSNPKAARQRRKRNNDSHDRPFEFFVFRN